MAILGGSPLGLIGVNSSPTRDGMSTFNGGSSRNINVFLYNAANELESGTRSLFSGPTHSTISPYGNVGKTATKDGGGDGLSSTYKGVRKSSLHSNDIYDTSTLNIIEKLSKTMASLRPADFAYLKDVGVYPNNRLMVARRFASPLRDNIFGTGNVPLSILIGWKPQDEDFLSMSFGEEWEDSGADFTSVMNSLGEDFMGKSFGSKIGGALGAIPLPGFTESLQRSILTNLGVIDKEDNELLPAGNPNLIKIAKKRKLITYGQAGSGLKCDISIKMVVEYEQKFISGIDPTIVWQDILNKIATFSTSRSQDYGLSKKFNETVDRWVNNPDNIVTDMISLIKAGLESAKGALMDGLNSFISNKPGEDPLKSILSGDGAQTLYNNVIGVAADVLKKQVQKYKVEIEGIARALSGAPSAPWHITLGNPLRPTFCSGDMLMEELTLTLGPVLAFNDLPSTIRAEFTMKNARPLGLQEILAKFNAGHIRTSSIVLTSDSLKPGQSLSDAPVNKQKPTLVDKASTNINKIGGASKIDTNKVIQLKDIKDIKAVSPTIGSNVALNSAIAMKANEQFEWSVLVDGRDRASGISTSLEDANRSINTFATGGTIVDKIIVSSPVGSTKEGKISEAINPDANSNIITSTIQKR